MINFDCAVATATLPLLLNFEREERRERRERRREEKGLKLPARWHTGWSR